MSTPTRDDELLAAIETHDVAALERLLGPGDAALAVRGKALVVWLLEMYFRSPRFPACLRLLLDRAGRLDDPVLVAVLLDDAAAVRAALAADPAALRRPVDLVSAFTPLTGASMLHVAAEYGNAAAARSLLAAGADVDARAADGHTPLFHTVSSLLDHGAAVMHVLLEAGARIDVRLPFLCWGRSFEWETTLFDVTPITWCQAGLLPQWHRREADVYRNLRALLAAGARTVPPLPNVPNRYLQPKGRGG